MKLILTDVDETVLCYSRPFIKWLEDTRGIEVFCDDNRRIANISSVTSLSTEEATELIHEFTVTTEAFKNLAPEPDAYNVLPLLYEDGYEFVAITACVDTPEVRQARVANLERAFGFPWKDVHCLGLHGDKRPYLKHYHPTIFVEDNFKHAVHGADAGHVTFLLERGHNTGSHPGVRRVQNWYDIQKIIGDI